MADFHLWYGLVADLTGPVGMVPRLRQKIVPIVPSATVLEFAADKPVTRPIGPREPPANSGR
jgi:hypothetical protein